MHDGRIEAHSDGLGKGSEFTVYLPIASRPAVSVGGSSLEVVEVAPNLRRRVLVADDNVDSAVVLATALRHAGHDVITAHDGPSAVAAAANFKPNVAILDIGMPHLSGYDVAKQLRRERSSHIMLIAVTGWGQDDDKRRATEAGFDHHLTKPVDLRAVSELLSADVDRP
jgi:CheY-like chemotaxis protein